MRLAACGSRGVGVLSVAKLTLGQEAYYEQQVVRGLDDYYAGRGESPGIWAGRGTAELELSGVVEDGDLGTLLRGINPAAEKQLRKPVRERTIAAARSTTRPAGGSRTGRRTGRSPASISSSPARRA
jgi:hypothetical protein